MCKLCVTPGVSARSRRPGRISVTNWSLAKVPQLRRLFSWQLIYFRFFLSYEKNLKNLGAGPRGWDGREEREDLRGGREEDSERDQWRERRGCPGGQAGDIMNHIKSWTPWPSSPTPTPPQWSSSRPGLSPVLQPDKGLSSTAATNLLQVVSNIFIDECFLKTIFWFFTDNLRYFLRQFYFSFLIYFAAFLASLPRRLSRVAGTNQVFSQQNQSCKSWQILIVLDKYGYFFFKYSK